MNNIWVIISNLASICSIIGLPIALFQIWKIGSTTKVMQQAICDFLSLEKIATLNKIFDTVTQQRNLLVSTYNNTTKKGVTLDRIKRDCENSIKEINTCVNNLPAEFSDIETLLVESAKCLNEYLGSGNSTKIRDCDDYLRGTISELKKIKEINRKFEIQAVSKNN